MSVAPVAAASAAAGPTTERKFRFDSFATEFACKDEDKSPVASSIAASTPAGFKSEVDIGHADNDSGIDSEETQVSPPLSTTSSPSEDASLQPLSLVVKKEKLSPPAATPKPRHWKKFLKARNEDEEAEDLSFRRPPPAKKIKIEDSRPLTSSLSHVKSEPPSSPVVSVARALLTLSQTQPMPTVTAVHNPVAMCLSPQEPKRHLQVNPAYSRLPHLHQPHRPIPVPLRPLQNSQQVNRPRSEQASALPPPPPPPYSSHPLAWVHRVPQQQHHTINSEPENLSIQLPQHPVAPSPALPLSLPPPQLGHSPSSAFLQLQSPTLSSTSRSPLQAHLRGAKVAASTSVMPRLPQEPVPQSLTPTISIQPTSVAPPSFLPSPTLSSSSTLSPTENFDHHPSLQQHEGGSGSRTSKKSSKKPFACTECKKTFSTQSGHAKHLQLHCSNQIPSSFSCKYCAKGYTSLSALKMHIRTHTLPCRCDTCGKSFSRPWLLQGHVRTHTGEKPFSCNYCNRSFADKSNLRAHLQTHLQTKKYSCPGCRKTFSRMSLLNKHTDSGCQGLASRNEECVQTLVGLSTSIRT